MCSRAAQVGWVGGGWAIMTGLKRSNFRNVLFDCSVVVTQVLLNSCENCMHGSVNVLCME